jgi:hypothetical protein
MYASEARQRAEEASQKKLDEVLEKIKNAADNGKSNVTVCGIFRMLPTAVWRKLEDMGYTYCARNGTIFW